MDQALPQSRLVDRNGDFSKAKPPFFDQSDREKCAPKFGAGRKSRE